MKKYILLFILAAFSLSSKAQGYNYMGKHVLFNAEGSISPAWLNPNPMTSVLANLESKHARRYLGLNYWLSPNVELMVWEKGSVGAGYNFYKSPFDGKEYIPDAYGYSYDFVNYQGEILAHGFNVFYKQYVGNTYAPLGHHFKFNFDGFFYSYYVPEMGIYDKDMLFGFKVEYGYDFLLMNCLRLTLGASVGTTFGGYLTGIREFNSDLSPFSYRTDLTYQNYARGRMLGAYWFGIRLGIGFLAF